ncbi:PREDICTED: alpha carbonic anhydrase 6-like [Erythranthe guttata]|uniref:alpha carbonic anhydrase 6-like n=1 Tax=Erythranthe guttata TaxID=4155 RepID=UPI00064DDB96|nr:PREDICTED: alpha carbonic anhydrase 6-like [Erythranthe guttata]|eukprot:XP_012828022.1 PREDICTED: alpha carbonic anhydrase 6-like [Erythranthe guttata]
MSTLKNNSLIILTLFNCLISSSFFFVVNAEFEAVLEDFKLKQVEWRGDAGGVTINGTAYKLEQCHWHIPSEHTINGVRFDMEMHIVHISSKGDIGVVSILYKLGSPDSFLARLLPHLENANREGTDVGVLDPLDIKFEGGEYYRYTGSLTTPPCSETATWTIIKTVSN